MAITGKFEAFKENFN